MSDRMLADEVSDDSCRCSGWVDRTLESQLIFVFHVSDGIVSEVWGTSLDDYANDEFWAVAP